MNAAEQMRASMRASAAASQDDGLDFLTGDEEGGEDVLNFAGQLLSPSSLLNFPVEFITGPAGTGKTEYAKRKALEDPRWGLLAATTGIAAVNMNTLTVNSLLKYFDTASLQDAFGIGKLQRMILGLAVNRAKKVWTPNFQRLVIDEVSMMDGDQLDLFVSAFQEVNQMLMDRGLEHRIGLTLTGDFCQLPPVKAKWAFEASVWPYFDEATTRLTKIWRQESIGLINGLNYLRQGMGDAGATELEKAGVRFSAGGVDLQFGGTTILGKNKTVDAFNLLRLRQVQGAPLSFRSQHWGQTLKEWGRLIPPVLGLKENALVMILANSVMEGYVNGDLGIIESASKGACNVELKRNSQVKSVIPIIRTNAVSSPPRGMRHKDFHFYEDQEKNHKKGLYEPPPWGLPYFDEKTERYVLGAIKYMPLRLGYATTVHKSQGLTLDEVQVDVREGFMSSPAMCYVAMSRAKNAEKLRVIGTPNVLAKRCNIDEKVRPWL